MADYLIITFDTKWTTHPNLVVNFDLVGYLCTQGRFDRAFFSEGGRAGGRAGNDVTLSLHVKRHVANV